jgi:hypothetical protein
MTSTTPLTCPRCLRPLPAGAGGRFCPHCGLDGAQAAAADAAPLDVTIDGRTFRVGERFAVGSVCTLYRCAFRARGARGADVDGLVKVARDARSNDRVANEAAVLRHLHAADAEGKFVPFLPAVEASFRFDDGAGAAPRLASVLRLHPGIDAPDELYTLGEVRAAYRDGLDPRDVAWVWRRLLNVLGFAHHHGVVHAAVLPPHVLVEPREHKLVLIDWCAATHAAAAGAGGGEGLTILDDGYGDWYRAAAADPARPPTPALDVALGARCMIDLLGGDPVRAEVPPTTVPPGLVQHFYRCAAGTLPRPDAWQLLREFDHLIESLWGARRFRPLAMPPRPVRR